jgi:hypothetical protein
MVSPNGNMPADASARIRFFASATGAMTAAVVGEDGRDRLVHSRIDPLREAVEWASLQEAVCGRAVLIGAGMGYPAAALLEVHRGIQELWLLEAEPLLLDATAASPPLAGAACRIRLLPAGDPHFALSVLMPHLSDLFSIHLSPSALSLAPKLYGPIVEGLEARLQAVQLERNALPGGGSPTAALVERMVAEIGS